MVRKSSWALPVATRLAGLCGWESYENPVPGVDAGVDVICRGQPGSTQGKPFPADRQVRQEVDPGRRSYGVTYSTSTAIPRPLVPSRDFAHQPRDDHRVRPLVLRCLRD